MSFLSRLFGTRSRRDAYLPLYRAIVAVGRDPWWYRDGRVPDTVDGRFDMISAVTALVLLRLETDGDASAQPSVLLTELYIADMEGSIREMGVGDPVVGKHIGRMMGAFGGRIGAFRDADAAGTGFATPVRRNIFRESPPDDSAVDRVAVRLEQLRDTLAATPTERLLAGEVHAA